MDIKTLVFRGEEVDIVLLQSVFRSVAAPINGSPEAPNWQRYRIRADFGDINDTCILNQRRFSRWSAAPGLPLAALAD